MKTADFSEKKKATSILKKKKIVVMTHDMLEATTIYKTYCEKKQR